MDDKPIIEVQGVWKRYGLPPLISWGKKLKDSDYALRDISFSVPRGGSLGILGRNGAGKSTLLKLLAGVTPPDKGSIKVRGSIFPMIELTAGMSTELSGRENVKILGTIMGLSSSDIRNITPKVHEFSELEEWFEQPVWKYSSGMVGRLAFGIAVNMRADILLVDEVLSTGDILFQKKCQQKVQELLGGGTTLIFVTHSPYQMERLCDKALFLEKGNLRNNDDASIVMQEYIYATVGQTNKLDKSFIKNLSLALPAELRPGSGDIRITDVVLQNSAGKIVKKLKTDEPANIVFKYHAKEEIHNFNIRADINDVQGMTVAALGFDVADKETTIPKGNGELICKVQSLNLYGIFFLSVIMKSGYLLDSAENILQFEITPTEKILLKSGGKGVVHIDSEWEGYEIKNREYTY